MYATCIKEIFAVSLVLTSPVELDVEQGYVGLGSVPSVLVGVHYYILVFCVNMNSMHRTYVSIQVV